MKMVLTWLAVKWARQDSNLRPTGYEPAALPLSYEPVLSAMKRVARHSDHRRHPHHRLLPHTTAHLNDSTTVACEATIVGSFAPTPGICAS